MTFTKVIDLSDELDEVLNENVYGFLNNINGIFTNVFESTNTTEVGENKYTIPHFPLDDCITENDIKGGVFDENNAEAVEQVLQRKMKMIAMSQNMRMEFAKIHCITQGKVYAPNNTVPATDWYKELGVERKSVRVKKVEDIVSVCNEDVSYIVIASPSSYIELNKVFTDVKQESNLPDLWYRSFKCNNVVFVEFRGMIAGEPLIEKNAYLIPLNQGVASVRYAPASQLVRKDTTKEGYLFKFDNKEDSVVELLSESNFLCVLEKPELIIELIV